MAQYSNEHLTIAELSAYIDKELAPEELALCDAHMQTCQPCQAALADLRLTSALLSSMPQVAVPRSFTLPTNFVMLPETPDIATGKTSQHFSRQTPILWRRSLRAVSTLVAVLGLFFFLAGALSSLPHGGMGTTTGSSASMPVTHPAEEQTPKTPHVDSTPQQRLSPDARATSAEATAMLTPTLILATPTYGNAQSQDQPPAQQPGLPAALDLGQAQGRLTIGAALLLLGILGAIVARLPGRASRR